MKRRMKLNTREAEEKTFDYKEIECCPSGRLDGSTAKK